MEETEDVWSVFGILLIFGKLRRGECMAWHAEDGKPEVFEWHVAFCHADVQACAPAVVCIRIRRNRTRRHGIRCIEPDNELDCARCDFRKSASQRNCESFEATAKDCRVRVCVATMCVREEPNGERALMLQDGEEDVGVLASDEEIGVPLHFFAEHCRICFGRNHRCAVLGEKMFGFSNKLLFVGFRDRAIAEALLEGHDGRQQLWWLCDGARGIMRSRDGAFAVRAARRAFTVRLFENFLHSSTCALLRNAEHFLQRRDALQCFQDTVLHHRHHAGLRGDGGHVVLGDGTAEDDVFDFF